MAFRCGGLWKVGWIVWRSRVAEARMTLECVATFNCARSCYEESPVMAFVCLEMLVGTT